MRLVLAAASVVSFAFVAPPAAAQMPDLPARGTSTAAFVPPGYQPFREATGHLNGDEYRDVVLILADARETPDSAPEGALPRLLVVLAGEEAGYRLEAATEKGVLGRFEGGVLGEPLEELTIDRNVIVITHRGGGAWRWRFVHRFRFQAGAYQLIGRTITRFLNRSFCPRLEAFRPTTHFEDDLVTGRRYRYEIPEHRCAKRESRSRIARVRIALTGFDLRRDVADR